MHNGPLPQRDPTPQASLRSCGWRRCGCHVLQSSGGLPMPLALPSRCRKAWVCPAQRGPCFRAALRRQSPPLSPPAASHATQCSPRPRSQDVLDSPEGLPLPTRHPVFHRPVPLHCWLADNGGRGGGYGGMVQIYFNKHHRGRGRQRALGALERLHPIPVSPSTLPGGY